MVDRKAVLTNLKNFYEWNFKNYPLNFDEAQVIIDALETKTTHAKWIDDHCSKCGCDVPAYIIDFKWQKDMNAKFCPQCGARMDGE